ncbi:MAG: FAD-binding oxidoreductase [Pseudomonadota bacterium]
MSPRIVVVGGGIVGTAAAWQLMALGHSDGVTVVERDFSLHAASTGRSTAGIRQQFSTPCNIRFSRYGLDFLRRMGLEKAGFRENGYLVLAGAEPAAERMRRAHTLQLAEGADIELLEPADLSQSFPHLNTDDVALASFGRTGEGWFDPLAVQAQMKAEAMAAGVVWREADAMAYVRRGDRVTGVRLSDGSVLEADFAVNAAGARGAAMAATADVSIPVEPRKRTAFAFTCEQSPAKRESLPLMIDSSLIWCRPEGPGFIAGRHPEPDPAVDPEDLEPRSLEFEEVIWPLLAARAPCFEAIRMIGLWAGHYAWCTHDQNAIIGPAPSCPNLILANGFSGHGVQHGPATGLAVAEYILKGASETLDASEFSPERLSVPVSAETHVW